MNAWSSGQSRTVWVFGPFSLGCARLALLLALLAAFLSVAPARAGEGSWTRIGLGGRRVARIAVDPANPNALFAGVTTAASSRADGGLYRSDDGGRTWTTAGLAPGDRDVSLVKFDPEDSHIVYVSTEAGLYRSADGGRAWTLVYPVSVDSVFISRSDPRLVLVHRTGPSEKGVIVPAGLQTLGPSSVGLAVQPETHVVSYGVPTHLVWSPDEPPPSEFARSADRGLTWQDVEGQRTGAPGLTMIAVDPTDLSVIVAADNGEGGGFGVARSTDGGASWLPVALPEDAVTHNGPWVGSGVAFNKTGTAVVAPVLRCTDERYETAVLRSRDDGKSWECLHHTLYRPNDQVSRPMAFLVDPLDADGLFVSVTVRKTTPGQPPPEWGWPRATRVWRSRDLGGSFAQVGSSIEGVEANDLAISQSDPRTIYLATSDGLWAYTFATRAGGLPATGEPPLEVALPILLGLGATLVVVGLRARSAPTV